MNTLKGKIINIEVENQMSLVTIDVEDTFLRTVILDTPDTASYLNIGQVVNVLFKETEVIIGTSNGSHISLQNRLKCKVLDIEKGKLLSKILLSFNDTEITSIITVRAVESLGLTVGLEVLALIKTNEIMLTH